MVSRLVSIIFPFESQPSLVQTPFARASGAALCLLPPGSARPALAGRLLLQAAVAGMQPLRRGNATVMWVKQWFMMVNN